VPGLVLLLVAQMFSRGQTWAILRRYHNRRGAKSRERLPGGAVLIWPREFGWDVSGGARTDSCFRCNQLWNWLVARPTVIFLARWFASISEDCVTSQLTSLVFRRSLNDLRMRPVDSLTRILSPVERSIEGLVPRISTCARWLCRKSRVQFFS
jgi:hypothetical protein